MKPERVFAKSDRMLCKYFLIQSEERCGKFSAASLGHGEFNVSPKFSSLALDEIDIEEQNSGLFGECCFEPELMIFVKKQVENASTEDDVIRVSGRINVSF